MASFLDRDPPEELPFKEKFDVFHKKFDVTHKKIDIISKIISILTPILLGIFGLMISLSQQKIASDSKVVAELSAETAKEVKDFNILKYAMEFEAEFKGTRDDLKSYLARVLSGTKNYDRDLDLLMSKFDARQPGKPAITSDTQISSEKWVALGFLPDDSSFDLGGRKLSEIVGDVQLKAATDVNIRKKAADWTGILGTLKAGTSVKVLSVVQKPAGGLTQIWAKIEILK